MRKIYKPLAIGTLFLALGSCSEPTRKTIQPEQETYPQGVVEVFGKPLSAAESPGYKRGSLALVLDIGGKKTLAIHDYWLEDKGMQYAEAVALVQSEINDGDDKNIKLVGSYDSNGKFLVKKLQANGYEVILD